MNGTNQREIQNHPLRRSPNRVAAIAFAAGLAAIIVPVPEAFAQPIKLVAETGESYNVGGGTWYYGGLGVPSLSSASSTGSNWNLAVRSSNHFFGSAGNRVVFFANSGVPLDQYAIAASDDVLPSAQFNRAAYLTASGIYSGNSLLAPHNPPGFAFGRPSAQGAFIAAYEWPVDASGSDGIVVNGPSGSNLLVHSATEGFETVGRLVGPNAANDISFGRGGLFNVVFRGHHSTNASRNGIFAKRYDGTQATQAIADNTMINPLTSSTFNFSPNSFERLPVSHGTGAAWSTTDGGNAVLSRPSVSTPINIASQGLGTYGNVSSGGGSMLVYEVVPPSGGATQVWQNLMGVETLCVDKTMITRRTVLDLAMGSEAIVPNYKPFSNPSGGGFTLGFHAYQLNPHTETAVYVKTIAQSGIDFGGRFGGDTHDNGSLSARFKVSGGGNTAYGLPEYSDFVTITARNDFGERLMPYQTYGSGLGVASGSPADDPSRLNTSDGKTEVLWMTAVYDMTVDGVTFTGMDVGESVNFLLDGTLVAHVVFEGNQVATMSGLQYIDLGSLHVPVGSYFGIEHGGGFDDGFAISSVIFGVVPSPSSLSLLGISGLVAARRRR